MKKFSNSKIKTNNKSVSSDTALKYYTKHCKIQAQEIVDLKNVIDKMKEEKLAIETELEVFRSGLNDDDERLRKVIQETIVAKNMYTRGLKQLKEIMERANKLLLLLKQGTPLYSQQLEATINTYKAEINKIMNQENNDI